MTNHKRTTMTINVDVPKGPIVIGSRTQIVRFEKRVPVKLSDRQFLVRPGILYEQQDDKGKTVCEFGATAQGLIKRENDGTYNFYPSALK